MALQLVEFTVDGRDRPSADRIIDSAAEVLRAGGAELIEAQVPVGHERVFLIAHEEKAGAVAARHPERLVLGADTTVVVDGRILGKPADMDDARRMLRMLAGRRHEVLTGVAVVIDSDERVDLQRTAVKFARMSEEEITFLAERGDPLDKAGAYAVQAQAAP